MDHHSHQQQDVAEPTELPDLVAGVTRSSDHQDRGPGGRVVGALALEDEIRPESYEAVRDLHALGLRVAMITGDNQAVADFVARHLEINEVAAQVLPPTRRPRSTLPGRSQDDDLDQFEASRFDQSAS